MPVRYLLAALLIGSLLPVRLWAAGEEAAILSDLSLSAEGVLTVRETITLRGEAARRARELRKIPILVRGRFGLRRPLAVKILKVLRDNAPFDFTEARDGRYLRLVPKEGGAVPEGAYLLKYEVRGAVERDGLHDSVAWTAGHAGQPRSSAGATLILPEKITPGDITAGAAIQPARRVWSSQGAKPKPANITIDLKENGHVAFAMTRELRPREQLTVTAWFPAATVKHTSFGAATFVRSNPTFTLGLLALLLLGAGYLVAIVLVGRDPARGRIVPRVELPAEITPALARYLYRGHFDYQVLTAAVLDMAVAGFITLRRNADLFSIHLITEEKGKKDLFTKVYDLDDGTVVEHRMPHEERIVAALLLRASPSFAFTPDNCMGVQDVTREVRESLDGRIAALLHRNHRFLLGGVVLSLLLLAGVALFDMLDGSWRETLRVIVGLVMTAGGGYGLVAVGWRLLRRAAREPVEQVKHFAIAIALTLLLLAFGAVGAYLLWHSSVLLLGLVAALGGVHLLAAHLLPAYTVKGRRLRDQIEGLRLFLATGYAPGRREPLNLDDFERYLPYAVALDAAEAWAGHFQHLSDAAGSHMPAWYASAEARVVPLSELVHLFTHRLTAAISDAAVSVAGLIEDPL
ncbi:MAG: DUF2207 family protein [Armatimonadota bacterium]